MFYQEQRHMHEYRFSKKTNDYLKINELQELYADWWWRLCMLVNA